MKRLLCAVFGHALPPGVRRELSIYFCCARCHESVRGDFYARPSRRVSTYLAVKGTKR